MKAIKFGMSLLVVLMLIGCGSTLQMDRGTVQTVATLDRDQYEITGDISGEASVTVVLFIFPIGAKPHSGRLYNPYNLFPIGTAPGVVEGMAVYNALENSPDADMIIAPRYETEVKGFPPIFWTSKVKVKGKGLKLK